MYRRDAYGCQYATAMMAQRDLASGYGYPGMGFAQAMGYPCGYPPFPIYQPDLVSVKKAPLAEQFEKKEEPAKPARFPYKFVTPGIDSK